MAIAATWRAPPIVQFARCSPPPADSLSVGLDRHSRRPHRLLPGWLAGPQEVARELPICHLQSARWGRPLEPLARRLVSLTPGRAPFPKERWGRSPASQAISAEYHLRARPKRAPTRHYRRPVTQSGLQSGGRRPLELFFWPFLLAWPHTKESPLCVWRARHSTGSKRAERHH